MNLCDRNPTTSADGPPIQDAKNAFQLVGVCQVPQLWLLQRAQPHRPQRGRQEQEGGRRACAAGGGQAGEDAGVKERISQMGHVNFAEFFILTPLPPLHHSRNLSVHNTGQFFNTPSTTKIQIVSKDI